MPNAGKLLDDFLLKEGLNEQEFHEENKRIEPLLLEISLIKNQAIQYFVRSMLLRAEEFWFAPVDDRPYEHPSDEYSSGGLVLHTKRVVRAADIIATSYGLDDDERDLVLAASILHDITKAFFVRETDEELFFDPMHPYTVDAFLKSVKSDDKIFGDESMSTVMYLKEETIAQIMRLIRCHMGLYSPVPETIPITATDMVVHLADLVATNLDKITYGSS